MLKFNIIGIRGKLIFYISLLLLFMMSLVSYTVFDVSRDELQKRIAEKLHVINDLKIEKINAYFKSVQITLDQIHHYKELKKSIYFVNENLYKDTKNNSLTNKLDIADYILTEGLISLKEAHSFNRILLVNAEGKLLYTTHSSHQFNNKDQYIFHRDNLSFVKAQEKITYTERYSSEELDNEYYVMALVPFKEEGTDQAPVIIGCELKLEPIYESINDTTGLGISGETILTQKNEDFVEFISPIKGHSHEQIKKRFLIGGDFAIPAQHSIRHELHGFEAKVLDYKHTYVDVAWSYIPELNWGIYTKIDHKESFIAIDNLRVLLIFLCSAIILISIIVVSLFANSFLDPIIKIRNSMMSLSQGEFPDDIYYKRRDEIYDTTLALNNLVERLKKSTQFAQEIGAGNLNASFQAERGKDVLSKALLSMRKSLIKIESENMERKWTSEGLAIHGEVLRKYAENMQTLGQGLISSLVEYVGAHHGGLYSVNYESYEDHDDTTNYYELSASYAYEIDETIPTKFKMGQGLIGQAALERETIYLKDTPLTFTNISSSLGEAKAGYVLIVPLRIGNAVLGVLELGSFKEFEDYKIKFIEKLAESIASSILSVKSSEKTHELLNESQSVAQELKEKEEELRENQTKMIEEQKKLKRALEKAEVLIKELRSALQKAKEEKE
ncbi:MAG: GAF domain-containing protein [Cytophagales bacterium]|nr:GAF domain-containing protein [Cytophagales bacterium]